jgi:hypothetical protein
MLLIIPGFVAQQWLDPSYWTAFEAYRLPYLQYAFISCQVEGTVGSIPIRDYRQIQSNPYWPAQLGANNSIAERPNVLYHS